MTQRILFKNIFNILVLIDYTSEISIRVLDFYLFLNKTILSRDIIQKRSKRPLNLKKKLHSLYIYINSYYTNIYI